MKYLIDWSIEGTTEIEASSAEEAQAKFDLMTNTKIVAGIDAREQHDGPSTAEERAAEAEEFRVRLENMFRDRRENSRVERTPKGAC